MAFRKHVMISIVLLSVSGLLMGCSEDATVAPNTISEAPLVAPANVTATILVNGTIELTWDNNSQPTLKGYNVYRLDQNAGTIGKRNSNLLTVNTYIDSDVGNGFRYEYWVTAVSVKGTETSPSATVAVHNYTDSQKDPDKDLD